MNYLKDENKIEKYLGEYGTCAWLFTCKCVCVGIIGKLFEKKNSVTMRSTPRHHVKDVTFNRTRDWLFEENRGRRIYQQL